MLLSVHSLQFMRLLCNPGGIWGPHAKALRAWGGQVRRGRHLVHDTMLQVQIAASRRMLKRPLKVAFWGEEGVDEGGVQKVRPSVARSSACSRWRSGAGRAWMRAACRL